MKPADRAEGPAVTRVILSAALLLLVQAASVTPAHAGNDRLDPTFGGDGRVVTEHTGNSISSLAAYPDGRVVALGWAAPSGARFTIARYNVDGSLDATFGVGGLANAQVSDFCSTCWEIAPFDVALQQDGAVVVAGALGERNGAYHSLLIRYDAEGNLDGSFATDGVLVADFADRQRQEWFAAVAIQDDGRIVTAGLSDDRSLLARYEPSGDPDPSFGDGGVVVKSVVRGGEEISEIAIEPDGNIVAVGDRWWHEFLIARFGPTGRLDLSFGHDGATTTEFAHKGYGNAASVAIQADGAYVVAGVSRGGFTVARYDPSGHLDRSFGDHGGVRTRFDSHPSGASGVIVQENGKIVAVGFSLGKRWRHRFTVVRYRPDGSFDPTFGGDGRVTTRFGTGSAAAAAVVSVPNGKIVVGGHVRWSRFGLARYRLVGSSPTATLA